MPLNGDLTNNGVGNPTISCNATVDNSGKIGKCYVCASGNHISFTNPITTSTTDFAISCWIYVTEYTSGYSSVFSSRTSTSGKGLALWIQSRSIRFDDGEMWSVSNTFSLNTWTHICVTYSKTNGKAIYVNGNLVGSKATVGTLANLRSELFIGYDHYGYYLGGKINDLRVWEGSTPSPNEIEILSRGLVVHYPLSGGRGEDNLLKYTAVNTANQTLLGNSINSAWKNLPLTTIDGFPCYNYPKSYSPNGFYSGVWYSGLKANTTYTYSAYLYFTEDIPFNFSSLGHFQVINYQSTASDKSHEDIASARIYEPSAINENTWTKVRITFTTNNLAGSRFTVYPRYGVASNVGELYFRGQKLEESPVPTPWVPNTIDNEYASMGYNSTTEYDVSGYNNHGTKIGSPTYSSDTPRYSTSTSFNGVDDCIQVPLNTFFPNAGSFTINLWFKKSELGSKGYETVFGGISGFEMDTRNGGNTTLSYYVTGNNRGLTVQSPLSLDTWYMLTMVCDGTNELYYLNGEYKKQIEKKGMPTGNYFIGAWNSATQQNFKGLISDFRVYSTALSATQIAELYNTAVAISNNGTLMGYGLVEQ